MAIKILLISISILIMNINSFAQVDTDSIYRVALEIAEPKNRLKALNDLLLNHPDIDNSEAVRTNIFLTSFAIKDSGLILKYALELINNMNDKPTANNRVAFYLTANGYWLDSALVFINRANEEFERIQGRKRAPFLDTKASVYYKMGEFNKALETQSEAISIFPKDREWEPNYASYYYNLSLYMVKSGKVENGLRLMARTSYEAAANEYLNAVNDKNAARSVIALGWAKQNILIEKSLEYATAGVDAIDNKTSIDDYASRYTTLGIVKIISGDYEAGIRDLNAALVFSSPYETELYLYLGKAYEHKGRNREAFNSYLSGVVGYKPDTLMSKLKSLHQVIYPDGPSLDDIINTEIKKTENFEVRRYEKPDNSEKVVLAELFTGSECKPCLAADIAYDKLLDRYDSKSVSILEYHLHIPAPDPMTNSDTEARAKFYGVNSTPTSIIEGVEKSINGGPRVAAKNRFEVFSATIEKHLHQQPQVKLNLTAQLNNRKLSFQCNLLSRLIMNDDVRLFFAIAEENVHYKGYNTVADHRFVVRKLLPSQDGLSLEGKDKFTFQEELNINDLENLLMNYIGEIEKKANKNIFKEKKHKINDNNLYDVAFVQNIKTKEILQSATERVKNN